MAEPPLRVAIAFPFEPAELEAFRAASPAVEIRVVGRMDQAAVDEAVAGGADGLIGQRLPSDLATAPSLRWLQVLSAGVDHLLVHGTFPPAIVLTNARGAYGGAIAQYTLGAILRVAERVDDRTAQQRLGTWPAGEDDFVGRRLAGRTLVILGYGGIGREIARVARAFGMRVIAVKARPDERIDRSYRPAGTGDPDGTLPERIVGIDGLPAAAAEADYLSITLPGGPGSRGVVGAAVLAALPSHAWLVNTGRGSVIDEAALIRTLEAGAIGGAVLDVFETEPLPDDSPLWRLPNVHITPHVAGGGASQEIAGLVVENLRRFGAGEPLLNQVDVQRGY